MATEEDGCEFVYLSDKNPRIIEMKPGVYHGYKSLEPNSILLYYLTHKYNTEDEIRVLPGYFGEDWDTPNK
jgi:dTDP-4-dehydrorhamnose 3,5-epimerase-like enzyme